MLVPSMNLEEIKKEIAKDFPIVYRKATYLEQQLRHFFKHRKFEKEVRFYDYVSKYKNNWIIRVEIQNKGSMVSFMAYYYNDTGLVAIGPLANSDYLNYYTAHFFKRFNERLQLNLVMPKDIIRAYANENILVAHRILEHYAPGLYSMFSSTTQGYVLGTCDENQMFYKLNTFITHEMLKGSQLEIAKSLNNHLGKYKGDAGNLK